MHEDKQKSLICYSKADRPSVSVLIEASSKTEIPQLIEASSKTEIPQLLQSTIPLDSFHPMLLVYYLGAVLCSLLFRSIPCPVQAFGRTYVGDARIRASPTARQGRGPFATNDGDGQTTVESCSPSGNKVVTAQTLRKIVVTDADGESVALGELMGQGTSIVVFLRHLGCFNCWSYAREWTLLKDEMYQLNRDQNAIVGPIFVSIGDAGRLNAFLDKNLDIPRSQMVVDGYDFAAYKQAGFGRFDEKPKSITDNVEPKPIVLGGVKGWWTFLTSFAPLAPVTPDMKFPEMFTPEGLFWVGGTMVVKGNEIVYRWNDRISGDHPDGGAAKVLQIARDASASPDPKDNLFSKFFGFSLP
jgi:hypothetical protein